MKRLKALREHTQGYSKNKKGITLVALVVTIIILLILAGVSISFISGNNGIFEKTEQAVNKYDKAAAIEQMQMKVAELQMKYYSEEQRGATLQEIADYLTADEYVEYVKIGKAKDTIDTIGYSTIIVKLKAYIYEFEITDEFVIKLYETNNEKDLILKIKDNNGIIGHISQIENSGYRNITIKGRILNGTEKTETYNVHTIVYDGDLVLDGIKELTGANLITEDEIKIYEFGDETTDVATESKYANSTVVLKVNGNLTINKNVILTACKSSEGYGGPKGMIIFCSGTITNNGTISMTARGAKAVGQEVFLWRNEDDTYEYVPSVGASGGTSEYITSTGSRR